MFSRCLGPGKRYQGCRKGRGTTLMRRRVFRAQDYTRSVTGHRFTQSGRAERIPGAHRSGCAVPAIGRQQTRECL